MIQSIVDFLLNLVQTAGLRGIGLAMFIESFFAPIPSEAIIPLGGFLVYEGKMQFWQVILVGGIGSYLGTLPFYFLGYWGHRERIYQFIQKYGKRLRINADDVDQAFVYFQKFGSVFVLLGRCIPLVRTFVSFPAGAVRMNFARFSVLTLIGSILRTTILTGVGYWLGRQWTQTSEIIKTYEHWVLGAIALIFVGWVARRISLFIHKKRKKRLEKAK